MHKIWCINKENLVRLSWSASGLGLRADSLRPSASSHREACRGTPPATNSAEWGTCHEILNITDNAWAHQHYHFKELTNFFTGIVIMSSLLTPAATFIGYTLSLHCGTVSNRWPVTEAMLVGLHEMLVSENWNTSRNIIIKKSLNDT